MTTRLIYNEAADVALACRACGVDVDEAESLGEPVEIEMGGRRQFAILGCCRDCAAREVLAEQAAAAHPRLAARHGNQLPAKVAACLHGMHLLAIAGEDLQVARLDDEAGLKAMVHRLTAPGRAVLWQTTVAVLSGEIGAARKPWEHVDQDKLLRLAEANRWLVRDRIAATREPLPHPPPFGPPGCLFCGLAEIMVPAIEVERAGGPDRLHGYWHYLRCSSHVLGGPRDPQPVDGHLCGTCQEAKTSVGAVGQPAITKAFSAYLRALGEPGLPDVDPPSFAALWLREREHGRPLAGNRTPWAHLEW